MFPDPDQERAVESIAKAVAALSTGDRAQLRRVDLLASSSSRTLQADGIVIGLLHHARVDLAMPPAAFRRWRLLIHLAALLSGTGAVQPHARYREVGTALLEAGYSERRLLMLCAVTGDRLHDQLRLAGRLLAQKGSAPLNLLTFLDLMSPERDIAEAARLRIAQDWYAAKARS